MRTICASKSFVMAAISLRLMAAKNCASASVAVFMDHILATVRLISIARNSSESQASLPPSPPDEELGGGGAASTGISARAARDACLVDLDAYKASNPRTGAF